MKGSDRLLLGIVIGIFALVAVALIIALNRPEPAYQPEESPSGVAHNYLLALQQENFDRAYGYLLPRLEGYPDRLEDFAAAIDRNDWRFRRDETVDLAVQSERLTGSRAVVSVRETRFYRGDLFSSGESTMTFDLVLERSGGEWHIVDGDYYFASCWLEKAGCE